MALTREEIEEIAHKTAVRAVIRHEQRFVLQGLMMTGLLGICGEVFRRIAGLDAIAFLLSRIS